MSDERDVAADPRPRSDGALAGAGRTATDTPTAFARRFVSESSLMSGVDIPRAVLEISWEQQRSGHLLAYRSCVRSALDGGALGRADLLRWQELIVREQRAFGFEVASEEVGALRGRAVRTADRTHPDPRALGSALDELLDSVGTVIDRRVAIGLAARSLLGLTSLRPFADGSGRVGRLLALWILVRAGVDPVVFHAANVTSYYHALADGSSARMMEYLRTSRVPVMSKLL